MISMNQVWDDAVAFIKRERALIVPLALATLLVGDVLVTLAGTSRNAETPDLGSTIVMLIGAFWSLVGQMAIIALVLSPGMSVGEALTRGASRIGKVLLIGLVVGLGSLVVVVPFLSLLMANGINPSEPGSLQRLPGWASLIALILVAVLIWVSVRLLLLNALIVDRNPGVFAALRTAFGLTRGIASRLAVVFLVYLLVIATLGGAVKFVLGSMFALLGAAMGSPFAGAVLTALGTGVITAALSATAAIFLATLYRRVISGT